MYSHVVCLYEGILTVCDIERAVLEKILPQRPVEYIVATSAARGYGARFGDVFHASRLITFVEKTMRGRGLREQRRRKGTNFLLLQLSHFDHHFELSPIASKRISSVVEYALRIQSCLW